MPINHEKSHAFRVNVDETLDLSSLDPSDTKRLDNAVQSREKLQSNIEKINQFQDRLYAERKNSLLIVLQGIDTSGKDGTIRSVFNATGPMGVVVNSFRTPVGEELEHDYLWRAHKVMPKKGMIAIFNRSYYEDVLIVRVKKIADHKTIDERYSQINHFEKFLTENGTIVLKFFLHISKDEQKKRLQERLDDPDKNWKFQPSDLEDRKLWHEYMAAYEMMLSKCSSSWAPWHVIPSDHKWARNTAISEIVLATLEKMDPQYPKTIWKADDFQII